MPGRAESLNAGVAGSIALFEAVRQRAIVRPANRERTMSADALRNGASCHVAES